MSNTNEDNELFDRDTPPQEEEKVDSNAAAREEHNRRIARIIEKDTHYIFFFGKIASGKSAIITYFINYLLGESEGTLVLTDLGESAYTNGNL